MKKVGVDRLIDYKGLLIYILKHWKKILLVGMICFVLGFSYRYFRNSNDSINEGDNSIVEYYKKEIETIEHEILIRHDYFYNTIVKEINPYSTTVSQTTYYVKSPQNHLLLNSNTDTEFFVEDNNTKMLLNALCNYIKYSIDWSSVKDKYSIENDVLFNELIKCEINSDSLNIYVYYSDEEKSNYIADYINESVEKQFVNLCEKTGIDGYELIQVNKGTTNVIFASNFNWATNRLDEINNLTSAKDKLQSLLNAKLDENPSLKEKKPIKSSLKIGCLSFVLGAILFSAIYVFNIVYKNVIISKEEFSKNVESNTVFDFSDLKKTNNNIQNDISDMFDLMLYKTNKNNLFNSKILFVTDICDERFKENFCNLKNQKSNICSDYAVFNRDSLHLREKIAEYKNIFCVIDCGNSTYDKYNELIEIIEECGANLSGFITI